MNTNRVIILSLMIYAVCSCQGNAQEVQDGGIVTNVIETINNDFLNQDKEFQIDFLERGFSNGGGFSVDIITGNSPGTPNSYLNLFMKEKVTTLAVNEMRYNDSPSDIQRIYRYADGLLISRYYSLHDVNPDETYKYDLSGRLISSQDFTYVYPENKSPDERERTIYYRGKFSSSEIIRIIDNGYEIYTRRSDSSESSRKYIYENGLLKHIIDSYPKEGREWNWVDFTYENGLLKGIVNATSRKDDIRMIIKVLSYDGSDMLEMERQSFRQGVLGTTTRWKFTNYDEYGNWHDAESYSGDGTLTLKYHRNIEYK